MDIFKAIEQMHRYDLQQVEKALRAQYLRLRQEDPMVYTVMRTRSGIPVYLTRCHTSGPRPEVQFYAQNMGHSHLRLFSSRGDAQAIRDDIDAGRPCNNVQSEVIEIPKKDMIHLPCYKYYRRFESYQPLWSEQ
jgi:hypothetical protein